MSTLVLQRCLHHPDREAVARCPECERFFCRECIAEHDDRIICASCLQLLAHPAEKPRGRSLWGLVAFPLFRAGVGLFVAWFCFYLLGHYLLTFPSDFHAGLWKDIFVQTDDD